MGKTVCRDHKDKDPVSKLITIETKTLQAPVLSCILESSGLPGLEGKVVLVTGANTGTTKILTRSQPTTSQLSVICQKPSPNNQKTTKVPSGQKPRDRLPHSVGSGKQRWPVGDGLQRRSEGPGVYLLFVRVCTCVDRRRIYWF